ncbi:NB-ARC domain-containing protein [Reticulomyxa filosa]|uniref:NB-ARC domain-containing protein n=1 Tax=Reticulomyxa filosa TaxID=46433 RepID=X6NGY0_RETFI|nr:NB-ARC domain-containing protein [Reticulomyxa filosa]|eukprot:ETO25575.1 NB-ARC domain-containing protein [Reticulomyxa filosa]
MTFCQKTKESTHVFAHNKKEFGHINKERLVGGMHSENGQEKYATEMKMLKRLCSGTIDQDELEKQLEENNGSVALVVEKIISKLINQNIEIPENDIDNKQNDQKTDSSLKKEDEKAEIGETNPGINLQGYCVYNQSCLASKANLPVWVNIGFADISFTSDKTSYCCPYCKQPTVTSIVKVMFFNSEHSIRANDDTAPVKSNNYQCFYIVKPGLTYELKASKIRQHAISLEDLIARSENAMASVEIVNLVKELERYSITVVKPSKVKDKARLLEKIERDYKGNYNQVFDIGRFTILCNNPTTLQTAVIVMKKAEQFNLIVSEDKDFFDKQSKTHHRFHNIKLYVPKHDVYIEMQATLKNFTTLEGYTVIENPKLSHLFYELIRAWEPNVSSTQEQKLKQASDKTLTKINDIICEWIDEKGSKKIAERYKTHSNIMILKPPQLSNRTEEEIKKNISLKVAQFAYEQLCKFTPEGMKGKALYVILYDYYKKYIIGDKNLASYADFLALLQKSRKQELEEDVAISQALETYIPLQANNYPHMDGEDGANEKTYDCHQHVLEFLQEQSEEKQEKEQKRKVMIIQGKSGSGKSIFCRHLEKALWEATNLSDLKKDIPIYISLSKLYNKQNEKDIILQALQCKHINKEIMDTIREKLSFVFIMDGFDEIFDFYRTFDNVQYFYDRFNLNQWNAKIVITCRSNVLHDDDINAALIDVNQNDTSMMYLWPFTKQQMHSYIEKFAITRSKNNKKNKEKIWSSQQYEETLNNYPNLLKMIEEPFLLQLILTVLPSLVKQYGADSKISKAQVYEAFNEQWIDIHVKNILSKLSELKIQTNPKKIKLAFQKYCQDLGFEMFVQGNQVATESDNIIQNQSNLIFNKVDPIIEIKIEEIDEKKLEIKTNEIDTLAIKIQDIWEKYFNGDSIAKYLLRRVGDNKYQFLHKSCQEYYASQKIIFDIISWKPDTANIDYQQFQQQFEAHISKLSINFKLLNEELGIIQFIAERIHDTNPKFVNLKSRLFRIIESSKTNKYINIAAANAITILNSANVNMHYQNWDNIKIPHAILDRAFLEGTSLNNANLDHVSFVQAFLNKTNFTNASMASIYFGEYAYLEGYSTSIFGVQLSPDGTKIVSCLSDKTIRIWDASLGKQIQLLKGHSDRIKVAQFSPDSSKIASCSADNTIRIWDILSGQQLQKWEEHCGDIQFSYDSSKIVSCSGDNMIRVWSVSSGKQIQLLNGHSSIVNAAQFSSDGSKIISCSNDKTIRIWNVLSGEQLQILEGHSDYVISVQFTANASKIISYSLDQTIRIWNASSGQQMFVLKGHSTPINLVRVSPDGLKMLSCSQDSNIRIWDSLSGKQVQLLEGHSDWIKSAQFSPDSSRVVSGSSDKTIRIWDVSSGKQLQMLEGHLGIVRGVEFFPRDLKILSYSGDKTIRIWDVALERKIQLTEGHLDNVNEVQFSPDGSKIVSSSLDKTVRLWDVQSGRPIQVFEGHSSWVRGIRFSPDGSKIASFAYFDKVIQMWHVASGKQFHRLEGHLKDVNGVQFSSDGTKIASCSDDKTIRIWDMLSGKQLQVLEGHLDKVSGVQFSPDSSKIVSCSSDKTVRLWDVFSGKQLGSFEKHKNSLTDTQFSPDGSKIVSCSSDKTIRIWDVSSGKQLLLLEGHSDVIKGVRFSPNASQIVSCSQDKTIRLWDASSGKQLRILEGHSEYIVDALFSSDGSKLISCSWDKTIRIWDVSSGKQVQLLEGHNGKIYGMRLSQCGSKIVSCSEDRTIRLWSIDTSKTDNNVETNLAKCIWQVGVQSRGLSMKDSVWKNTTGLTPQQKLLVEQRGGKY